MANGRSFGRRGSVLAVLVLVLGICRAGEQKDVETSARHDVSAWPQVEWPLAQDAALDKRIDQLLATMTVEEKVGQLVQGDIASITPDDVRKYRLGSILAGGNSDPGGRHDAPPADWLALADAFYEASMDTSQGGKAIPLLFGIDAVHGQSNIVGATLFPHNIGLAQRAIRSCCVASARSPRWRRARRAWNGRSRRRWQCRRTTAGAAHTRVIPNRPRSWPASRAPWSKVCRARSARRNSSMAAM